MAGGFLDTASVLRCRVAGLPHAQSVPAEQLPLQHVESGPHVVRPRSDGRVREEPEWPGDHGLLRLQAHPLRLFPGIGVPGLRSVVFVGDGADVSEPALLHGRHLARSALRRHKRAETAERHHLRDAQPLRDLVAQLLLERSVLVDLDLPGRRAGHPAQPREHRPVLLRCSGRHSSRLQPGRSQLRHAVGGGSPGRAVRRRVPLSGDPGGHGLAAVADHHARVDLRRRWRLLRPRPTPVCRPARQRPTDVRSGRPNRAGVQPVRVPRALRRRLTPGQARLRLPPGP